MIDPDRTLGNACGSLVSPQGNRRRRLLSTSVLITGGAGFIGSALARRLVEAGYDVAVMDVLHPQVHGEHANDRPAAIRAVVHRRCHPCARLGCRASVVPSFPDRPSGGGDGNGAVALRGDAPWLGQRGGNDSTSRRPEPLSTVPDQLVLASSRAVYGEGAWRSGTQIFYPQPRSHAQLLAGIWDPQGPTGEPAVPLPSCAGRTEPRPTNIYAATKLAQEHILAAWTAAHDTNLSVLRLQNVYGPGQSLTNSYTGIVLFSRDWRASSARWRSTKTGGSCAISSISKMSSRRCSPRSRSLRLNRAASTSGRASRPPSTSWPKRSPPSAAPPNRSS